jgi:hypothetical protein
VEEGMDRVCSSNEELRNTYTIFVDTLKERDHF